MHNKYKPETYTFAIIFNIPFLCHVMNISILICYREADSASELVRRYGGMFVTPESQR